LRGADADADADADAATSISRSIRRLMPHPPLKCEAMLLYALRGWPFFCIRGVLHISSCGRCCGWTATLGAARRSVFPTIGLTYRAPRNVLQRWGHCGGAAGAPENNRGANDCRAGPIAGVLDALPGKLKPIVGKTLARRCLRRRCAACLSAAVAAAAAASTTGVARGRCCCSRCFGLLYPQMAQSGQWMSTQRPSARRTPAGCCTRRT
jgi:hypothetical protein